MGAIIWLASTWYDNGYLYLSNNLTPTVGIVDLTDFDPDNPPERISDHKWLLDVGTDNVHDTTVMGGRLYAAGWNDGLFRVELCEGAATVWLSTFGVDEADVGALERKWRVSLGELFPS